MWRTCLHAAGSQCLVLLHILIPPSINRCGIEWRSNWAYSGSELWPLDQVCPLLVSIVGEAQHLAGLTKKHHSVTWYSKLNHAAHLQRGVYSNWTMQPNSFLFCLYHPISSAAFSRNTSSETSSKCGDRRSNREHPSLYTAGYVATIILG